jgi:hypothetical protein
MPEPRKHHYLPQFYLRGFSANGRSIFQIEKRGHRVYPSSIRDTTAIRDYHELDTVGVEDPGAVEKQLTHVETQLAQGLAATLRSGITTPEVHSLLIQLVALLRVRVPAFKATIEAHLQGIVRSTGLMMERRGAFPPPPKGFEDVLRMDNLLINISNWKLLETMFTISADRDVFNMLAAMRPTLLRALRMPPFSRAISRSLSFIPPPLRKMPTVSALFIRAPRFRCPCLPGPCSSCRGVRTHRSTDRLRPMRYRNSTGGPSLWPTPWCLHRMPPKAPSRQPGAMPTVRLEWCSTF